MGCKPRSSANCPGCGDVYQPFRCNRRGIWNKKPYQNCLKCWRDSRKTGIESKNSSLQVCASQISMYKVKSTIGHQVFYDGAWHASKFRDHPTVLLKVGMENRDNSVFVNAIADTGAQSNLWGYKDFARAGFVKADLRPVSSQFRVADDRAISIVGAFNGMFESTTPRGKVIRCRAMVYVSSSVSGFFLSFDTLLGLRVIDQRFPEPGRCEPTDTIHGYIPVSIASLVSRYSISCKCPQRSAVPIRPTRLPFDPVPANIPKMRAWLLEKFASSTFNTCPHRPLQEMAGPPIEMHLQDNAKPKACDKPATIPLHWQAKVRQDLLRDEALGVIERVPYGTPNTWCHRMVVTRKGDGSPRRTVDLSPLNKFCRREPFGGESPFSLARRVPGNTWKTVSDAWNGYHSVPLRESDRHLTTFITPFGRYRYTRAPQGFLSSGDGYNRRFDAILSEFQRKERCVDDTVHYDDDLAQHWWRTIEFLSIVGAAGIVLNPEKFQFCKRQVDFAGFRITDDHIEPLPKYLDAIRSFPTPQGITDIRSWFGLITQVSSYAQLRDLMAPFRKFLSPKVKFFWDQDLDDAFTRSKELIVKLIQKGVQIFDTKKPTCLRVDWSGRGIGYFLLQKHCSCPSELPDCCQDGWRVTLAGSRFLVGAEVRYAAIEGEALAIVWGLQQTKYFTQGCNNLIVVTDHKPLVGLFGSRTLDQISNTRLFRLKQKTLPWYFRTVYLPGKSNYAADAASRYPDPGATDTQIDYGEDFGESALFASIAGELSTNTAISWSMIVDETSKDPTLCKLRGAIYSGFQESSADISEYLRFKDSLYIGDGGVIMYMDRAVIPSSLRKQVARNLHSAHQGTAAMLSRAQTIVFWPGITQDIKNVRDSCQSCNENAPSQAATPAEPITTPSLPFQQIFADFFAFAGRHFLVVGDRLSGWSEIYSTPTGSHYSGSRGLIRCLRSFFSTFGVPEELSSDGGPEFAADSTKAFLCNWNIRHRISSAYHAQSNGRAEVAVKSAKRLLRKNLGPNGSLDTDELLRAMLQLRNTPDPDCKVSPAEVIFGRPLRDAFSFVNRGKAMFNPNIKSDWREAWRLKELAVRKRYVRWCERHNLHTRDLAPLRVGSRCFVQNQEGARKNKWDRSGIVVDALPHGKYTIRLDGSGRLTNRNRRFLRLYKSAPATFTEPPAQNQQQPATDVDGMRLRSATDDSDIIDDGAEPVEESAVRRSIDIDNDIEHAADGVNDMEDPVATYLPVDGDVEPVSDPVVEDGESANIPLCLRRLRRYNRPGLQEDEETIRSTRLRIRQ